MVRPPDNFAAIIASSDDAALFDLLASPQGVLYEYDHVLLASIMCRLKGDLYTHRFVHVRLKRILQAQAPVCARLLDTLPSLHSDGGGGVEFLLADLGDNFYLYSLLVEAFVVDFGATGRRSRMFKLVHSIDGRRSVRALARAVMKPFVDGLSFQHKRCAVELFDVVAACNGIKGMAETAAELFADEQQFVWFVRHLKLDRFRVSLLHEYLVEKRVTACADLHTCLLSLGDETALLGPVKDEFILSARFLQTAKEPEGGALGAVRTATT